MGNLPQSRKRMFSMETEVPVWLKMPLKRKIVNHVPPGGRDDCPASPAEFKNTPINQRGSCGSHLHQVLGGLFTKGRLHTPHCIVSISFSQIIFRDHFISSSILNFRDIYKKKKVGGRKRRREG